MHPSNSHPDQPPWVPSNPVPQGTALDRWLTIPENGAGYKRYHVEKWEIVVRRELDTGVKIIGSWLQLTIQTTDGLCAAAKVYGDDAAPPISLRVHPETDPFFRWGAHMRVDSRVLIPTVSSRMAGAMCDCFNKLYQQPPPLKWIDQMVALAAQEHEHEPRHHAR